MTYLIDTWYVEDNEGNLSPVQNYGTAKYLVEHKQAVRIVDVTREVMSK